MAETPSAERLTRIVVFLETIDQLKSVYRAAYLGDHSRNESSAEHTWHMAMFALLLAGETDIEMDVRHVLEMILIHDLVEIYAGDTWIHHAVDREMAKEREKAAADRLFADLPDDLRQRIRSWWDEFEEGQTVEAQFARAMDRLHGFTQNIVARGRVWQERGVTEEMTRAANREAIEFDPIVSHIYAALYKRANNDNLWEPRP